VNDKQIIAPLVNEILALANDKKQEYKKKLWAGHQALKKTDKIPVCVYYEGIPDTHWKLMLGANFLKCKDRFARGLESGLRKRLWIANNVPDDHIVWPELTVSAMYKTPISWGVDLKWEGSEHSEDTDLEAKRIIAIFGDGIDVSKLNFTDQVVDNDATNTRKEQAADLVDNRLSVNVNYASTGFIPFDLAVRMCGIENMLYNVIDAPDKVHALMDYITSAFEKNHINRNTTGAINCRPDRTGAYAINNMRVHSAYLAPDFKDRKPNLTDEWVYISAQTSSGLSPTMYNEFVHQYNCRLAKYFTNKTVYYHGCECLDKKVDIISTLPNLRRFHVSPWSTVKVAAEKFGDKVVLETHAHPGKVFFGYTKDDMKKEVQAIVDTAGTTNIDINLSDIHSINNNPQLLIQWAEAAQEVSNRK